MSDKCPTCGSDDPREVRALSISSRYHRWIPWWPGPDACKDQWHTCTPPVTEDEIVFNVTNASSSCGPEPINFSTPPKKERRIIELAKKEAQEKL